jgi:Cu2+-exporting ATPase
LGFGIGASVVTNNIAALAALANGLLPMRRVAQLEAERRHMLELELRQSGFLREVGSPLRPAEPGAGLVPAAVLTAAGDGDAQRPYPTALAAD